MTTPTTLAGEPPGLLSSEWNLCSALIVSQVIQTTQVIATSNPLPLNSTVVSTSQAGFVAEPHPSPLTVGRDSPYEGKGSGGEVRRDFNRQPPIRRLRYPGPCGIMSIPP